VHKKPSNTRKIGLFGLFHLLRKCITQALISPLLGGISGLGGLRLSLFIFSLRSKIKRDRASPYIFIPISLIFTPCPAGRGKYGSLGIAACSCINSLRSLQPAVAIIGQTTGRSKAPRAAAKS